MAMNKYCGLFALSMTLMAGCGEASDFSPEQTDNRQQQLIGGGFVSPNGYTKYYTATVINNISSTDHTKDVPIRGIHYSNTSGSWYVMDASNDYAALIDSITYQGQAVAALSSSQGWFWVTMNSQTIQGTAALSMHVAAPFNGTIQITPSGTVNATSAQRYLATFKADGVCYTSNYKKLICPPTTFMNPSFKFTATGGIPAWHEIINNHYLIPIAGTKWDLNTGATTADADTITFSSGYDAVGTCVSWGYEPWSSYTSCVSQTCVQNSMAPVHQACTRMKRADFCGDGSAWTDSASVGLSDTDLTTLQPVFIQLWDNAAVHTMTPQTLSTMEASWSPTGASCVNMNELRISSGLQNNGALFDAATTCGSPIPTCAASMGSFYTGSARPCTQADSSGNCIAN